MDRLPFEKAGATYNATAGVTYYVIVDGFSGATSSFDLDIACL